MMARENPAAAAESYEQARTKWRTALDLSVYDDPRVIRATAPLLERAIRLDPAHVGALVMLADLLAALTAYEEAAEFAQRAAELDPAHPEPGPILALPNGQDKRLRIMEHLEDRWRGSDW